MDQSERVWKTAATCVCNTPTLCHVDQGNSKFLSISIYSHFISVWDFWNWMKHWKLCSREWPERVSCKTMTGPWLSWCKGEIPVEVYSPLRSQVSKEADKVTGERFLVFWCNHWDRSDTKEVMYQGHSCFKWMEMGDGKVSWIDFCTTLVEWSWLTHLIWRSIFFLILHN